MNITVFDCSKCRKELIYDAANACWEIEGFDNVKQCIDYMVSKAMICYIMQYKGIMVSCVSCEFELENQNQNHGHSHSHSHNKKITLRTLYVDPEYRNQGIGSRMIQIARRQCQYYGHDSIVVHPRNDSTSLFLHNGFHYHGRNKDILKSFL